MLVHTYPRKPPCFLVQQGRTRFDKNVLHLSHLDMLQSCQSTEKFRNYMSSKYHIIFKWKLLHQNSIQHQNVCGN